MIADDLSSTASRRRRKGISAGCARHPWCAKTLAELGREFDLGDHLILGAGELKAAVSPRSILADTVEAVIGAIYLDTDLERVQPPARLVCQPPWRDQARDRTEGSQDPSAKRSAGQPSATADLHGDQRQGRAHNQEFTVQCEVDGLDGPWSGSAPAAARPNRAAAQGLERLSRAP